MSKSPKTLAELYQTRESLREQGKALYEQADAIDRQLVRVWKKDKRAKVDAEHVLEIEDQFRGRMKCFAPAYAHRYKVKLKSFSDN